jgi:hypothetical protein
MHAVMAAVAACLCVPTGLCSPVDVLQAVVVPQASGTAWSVVACSADNLPPLYAPPCLCLPVCRALWARPLQPFMPQGTVMDNATLAAAYDVLADFTKLQWLADLAVRTGCLWAV